MVWVTAEALIYQILLRPGIERDLGFRGDTAILPNRGLRGYVSAVAVRSVVDDRPFGRAGIRSGDVLPDESHTSLFKKLHHSRGQVLELAIVDGGAGPPFHQRTRRVTRIIVP